MAAALFSPLVWLWATSQYKETVVFLTGSAKIYGTLVLKQLVNVGVESLSLILSIFHESFPLTPGLFLKRKKYLHRHPVD
jgi:hypothetical protein